MGQKMTSATVMKSEQKKSEGGGSSNQRSDIDNMSADELRQLIEHDRGNNPPMILASSKGFAGGQ